MWDLDQIIRQNNQVALDYMMRGLTVTVAQSPQPENCGLTLLAGKLIAGPPLLSELMNCFANMDTTEGFRRLIRVLLPEHEKAIMSEPRPARVYRFCYLFGKKYFPLPPYTFETGLSDFVNRMPVELLAMSYSAYHELEMRRGYLLLLSLVIYPYEGDERDMDEYEGCPPFGDDGGRVPLLDLVQRIVGADLVGLIPAEGWEPADLHRMTDGTPYEGVGHFADWACSKTGCVVLDSSYDGVDFMEGYGEPSFQWTKDNVDILTGQWPKVVEFRGKIDHIVEWLEADPINNFKELLEFLLTEAPRKLKGKKKAKGSSFSIGKRSPYDPTEHFCPLKQALGDEEDDNAE